MYEFYKKKFHLKGLCHETLLRFYQFKGTVQRDFRPPFFHHSNRSLTNGLKYFRFWFRFRRDFCIFPEFRAASY